MTGSSQILDLTKDPENIIIFIFLTLPIISVIGFFWALGRLFQYTFGKYSDYIMLSNTTLFS